MRLFFVAIFFILAKMTYADTYPEVVFDNSLVKGSYARSHVEHIGHSWVENVNQHLLVSDTLFFTPGNSLSLKYISSPLGHWSAKVKYSRQKINYQIAKSDFLTFKLFVQSIHTTAPDLPKVAIQQGENKGQLLSLLPYIEDFQHNMWVNVRIPVKDFNELTLASPISAIVFSENKTSNATHHLFIDQIEFLPQNNPNTALSSPAILSKITAYDQQIHLNWQLPLTPSIRYIKIYRSEDNINFDPIAIRPIHMQGCFDYVPELNKIYYYKIAWVDYNYRESPFSEVKEIKTAVLNNDQLLDLIQFAHINYFVENYDINSGMYLPYRVKEKPIVSLKETGYAILSMIVGVEKGFIPKNVFINRIDRISKFLAKAQNREGIYPAYFDGRKGLPEHINNKPSYDILATTSIVNALLVTKQYLKKDADSVLINRIDQLYDQINWSKIVDNNRHDVLKRELSGTVAEQDTLDLLGGINESLNAYLLAMGSTNNPIPLTAFENGAKSQYEITRLPTELSIDSISQGKGPNINQIKFFTDSISKDSLSVIDSIIQVSIFKDTVLYGLPLKLSDLSENLLSVYAPFFTIDPSELKENGQSYKILLDNLSNAIRRRDNEIGVGTTNSEIWGFYLRQDSLQSNRINPAIGVSSIFVNKELGIKTLSSLYKEYADVLFTEYGFRGWLDLRNSDVSEEYMALNQASIAILIENARSGLIWKLYNEIPAIQSLQGKLSSNK